MSRRASSAESATPSAANTSISASHRRHATEVDHGAGPVEHHRLDRKAHAARLRPSDKESPITRSAMPKPVDAPVPLVTITSRTPGSTACRSGRCGRRRRRRPRSSAPAPAAAPRRSRAAIFVQDRALGLGRREGRRQLAVVMAVAHHQAAVGALHHDQVHAVGRMRRAARRCSRASARAASGKRGIAA